MFHQAEGVRLFTQAELQATAGVDEEIPLWDSAAGVEDAAKQAQHAAAAAAALGADLRRTLEGLTQHLFGDVPWRWVDAYFPFTHPSWELEIFFHGEWLEVLGCGVMRQAILQNAGAEDKVGWAFGLGLERLAMVLYDVPDIR